jgi:hypothetical protein
MLSCFIGPASWTSCPLASESPPERAIPSPQIALPAAPSVHTDSQRNQNGILLILPNIAQVFRLDHQFVLALAVLQLCIYSTPSCPALDLVEGARRKVAAP